MINQLNFRQLGSGKDIIILHGLLGSLDNWISVAHKLASNYKITILDLPNHGKSYHSDLFSYKEMADVLNNFIEKKKYFKSNNYWPFYGRKGSSSIRGTFS